jgi:hypothetical protein
MTIHDDIAGALESRAASGRVADKIIDAILDRVIAALRRRFPAVTRAEFELLLADARMRAEELLDARITDTVHIDTVLDLIERFFGGDV